VFGGGGDDVAISGEGVAVGSNGVVCLGVGFQLEWVIVGSRSGWGGGGSRCVLVVVWL